MFGRPDEDGNLPVPGRKPVYKVITGMVDFAVENPELGRIWLFELLSSNNPGDDQFFKQFEQATETLAKSERGGNGIDAEVLSVMMLAGYLQWPVWVRQPA